MNDFLQSSNNGQKNKRVPRTRKAFDNNHSYNSNPKFHSGKYQGVRNENTHRLGNVRQNFQAGTVEKTTLLSPEAVESIVSLVRTITINQELLIDVQERRLSVEDRKAGALENIAEYLNSLPVQGEIETEDDQLYRDEVFQEEEEKYSAAASHGQYKGKLYAEPEQDNTADNNKLANLKTGNMGEEKLSAISPVNSEARSVLSREEAMETICRMREHGATFSQIATHLIEINQPTFSGKGKWHAQTIHRLMQKQKQSGLM